MMMTKKSILAGVMVATSGLLLSACSSSSSDEPTNSAAPTTSDAASTGTLTVWLDDVRADALQTVADDYEAATGISVEIVGRDAGTMKDDFIQQANSGSGPDVVMGAHDWLGELTTNGVVAPLELGDTAGNYLTAAIDGATYDGTVYMLPYSVENVALLRNVDLVPDAPSTFDEMITMGQASGAEIPFAVQQGEGGDPYHLYAFQTSFGAPVFGRDDSGSYDPANLTLGEGSAFAEWLGAQGAAGTLSTDITPDIAQAKFNSGDVAYWLTGPWNVSAAVEAGINVAVSPIPSAGTETAAPFAGIKGFFVNQYSENKVAANDFLVNYIGTEDVQMALYESSSTPPALTAAADAVAAADTTGIVSGFVEAGKDAVPMPAIPQMGSVWQFWGTVEAAIINGADPDATWAQLTSDVQGAIDAS